MRVWDISPGYLNRQSLLGEHRELHGIVSIIVNRKKGYSKHPETLRWIGYGWALRQRHRQLACEMSLRGYTEKTPVSIRSNKGVWPNTYIDKPIVQFKLLKGKYLGKEKGRIPLPNNAQQIWSQHKYSVLARDEKIYREIGREVAERKTDFSELAKYLTEVLQMTPSSGGLRNTLQHMWGHVSGYLPAPKGKIESWSMSRLLKEIQSRAISGDERYLTSSTALNELMVWLPTV